MGSVLRFGVIGCGDIVEKSFVPSVAATNRAALIAATRRDSSKLEGFCSRSQTERPYGTVEELLADRNVDGVYVATPVSLHAKHIVAAAEAGKHVLCEKPFGRNLADAKRSRDASIRNGVKLLVAYYRRGFPEVGLLRSRIEQGGFGEQVSVRFHFGMQYQPDEGGAGAWRVIPDLGGGGALMDVGSHRLDLVCDLLAPPLRVVCRLGGDPKGRWEVESSATVIAEMAGGGEAQLTVSWNQTPLRNELWVLGTRGAGYCPELRGGILEVRDSTGSETVEVAPTPKTLTHVPVIEAVASEVIDGRPTRFGVEEIIATPGGPLPLSPSERSEP